MQTETVPLNFVSPRQKNTERAAINTSGRWSTEAVLELIEMPFMSLLAKAHAIHAEHFDENGVQRSTLLSIKTGGCSEDCGYCSQSARYDTDVGREALMSKEDVITAAKAAKDAGSSRFCMGAAWRGPKDKDLDQVVDMVQSVKALGLETCVTLGMLKPGQAEKLATAGLDYYNHNLDTDSAYYSEVISTHTHDDRLDTLDRVRKAGIHVCSGGIVGMGENRKNRAALIAQLANLDPVPDSVPINNLVPIPGTPMAGVDPVDGIEFVRMIAAARITMPTSWVRLSAGRQEMSDELQALCFFAGANSIFYGEQLLTTGNPDTSRDQKLFATLGLKGI